MGQLVQENLTLLRTINDMKRCVHGLRQEVEEKDAELRRVRTSLKTLQSSKSMHSTGNAANQVLARATKR